mmetsp:Transcript_8690/g.11941  ORF Transcript_8690/g.11941 Transcript_8690/m.11941 type:complete len:205 (-) Transcript_8690:314-928(-)
MTPSGERHTSVKSSEIIEFGCFGGLLKMCWISFFIARGFSFFGAVDGGQVISTSPRVQLYDSFSNTPPTSALSVYIPGPNAFSVNSDDPRFSFRLYDFFPGFITNMTLFPLSAWLNCKKTCSCNPSPSKLSLTKSIYFDSSARISSENVAGKLAINLSSFPPNLLLLPTYKIADFGLTDAVLFTIRLVWADCFPEGGFTSNSMS